MESSVPIFKKVKRKNIRKTKITDDNSDDDSSLSVALQESRELRKMKKRMGGVSAEDLLNPQTKKARTDIIDDPFQTQAGGMVDLETVKNAKKIDDAYDTGIGTAFSVETNRRDEDAEMQKYIEINLAKRKGLSEEKSDLPDKVKYQTPEEAALMSMPDYLIKGSTEKSEEMLSNQMLSGIPEVDLGLEVKIKNIEATEEAKQKLIRESLMKKDRPSEFVPKNMAVNFVQHNRFNIDETVPQGKKKVKVKDKEIIEPVVGGGVKISTTAPKKTQTEKATDDFHYEKFRKQFRRH